MQVCMCQQLTYIEECGILMQIKQQRIGLLNNCDVINLQPDSYSACVKLNSYKLAFSPALFLILSPAVCSYDQKLVRVLIVVCSPFVVVWAGMQPPLLEDYTYQ